MGLFGFGTKTKADWDREIMRLNERLTHEKGLLATYKARPQNYGHAIAGQKQQIERVKAELANAKIQRRNAPK